MRQSQIVGYGEYCAFDFPCFGPDCKRRFVCNEGIWRPEVCSGFDCGRKVKCTSGKCQYVTRGMAEWEEKVTCYGNYCQVERCSDDACYKKYLCKDDSCIFETCPAEEAFNKYEWSGDKYNIVKGCDGNCPEPQPPCENCGIVIPQASIAQTACSGTSCSTVVVPQPPFTKTPYQTVQSPVQTPAQPPVQISSQAPAAPAASSQPPVVIGQPPAVAPGTTKPVNVVTAGSSKSAASLGALACSVFAAALLL
ncbi:hypothetical protein CDEST_03841 [Colletotrichum destructivum]|uniref:Uncharacterized protein n=1 Tax=Colletotrichum destructivum TaxID=34406 RepID=A0AAX4I6Q0_9PEZI|nr:hypothetical protein CDEST_03841 [Colletotrichum destructivum]